MPPTQEEINQAAIDQADTEKDKPFEITLLQALEAMLEAVKCAAMMDSSMREHIAFVESYIKQEKTA